MINIRRLREFLQQHIMFWDGKAGKSVKDRITIKRKKKMILETSTNGNVKAKRRSYLKIEIIE